MIDTVVVQMAKCRVVPIYVVYYYMESSRIFSLNDYRVEARLLHHSIREKDQKSKPEKAHHGSYDCSLLFVGCIFVVNCLCI